MSVEEPVDRRPEEAPPPKRPWIEPTLEVTPVTDAEGTVTGFPTTDSVTNIS